MYIFWNVKRILEFEKESEILKRLKLVQFLGIVTMNSFLNIVSV